MSITATNNPYPESPDPTPSKLDKGGYEGTAETLDNKINEVLAEVLLMTNNLLTDVKVVNGVTPTSAIPPTGNIYTIVTTDGTYVNWNNLVVPVNSMAVLMRVDGVYSVSQTAFDISGKLNVSDVVDSVNSTETAKAASANSVRVLNERFKQTEGVNLFDKNDVTSDVVLRPDNVLEAGYTNWFVGGLTEIKPSTNYYLTKYGVYGIYDSSFNELAYVAPFTESNSTFTTPSTAKYIRVQARIDYIDLTQLELGTSSTSFTPFVSSQYNLNELNKEIFFNPAEPPIQVAINKNFVEKYGVNLFNKNNVLVDSVLQANNVIAGGYVNWFTSQFIKIKPSTNYYLTKYGVYGLFDKNLNQITYVAPFTETNSAFTTPSNAKYVRITARVDYLDGTMLKEGVADSDYVPFSETYYNKNNDDVDIFFNPAPEKVKELAMGSYLYNKDWLALGDSITFRDEYTGYVSTSLGLNSFTNKGVSGRQVYQMIYEKDVDGLGTLDLISPTTLNQHDIISFCGFANNYAWSTPIGSITDAINGTSFYSQVKTVIEYLCTNAPDKLIVGIGALQMKGYFAGDFGTVNLEGKTTFDYSEAMRLTCEFYGIPFVDLYKNGGVNKLNADTYYASPDYVHPNNTNGMQKMGRLIASKFKQLSEKIV